MKSNYPPGVTGSEPQIVGDGNDSDASDLLDHINSDMEENQMTDREAFVAWRLGVAAYIQAKRDGAKWPHDPEDEEECEHVADETQDGFVCRKCGEGISAGGAS